MNVLMSDNVSFSYRPGKDVLKNISFAVGKGEQVALIGANGAGKSTLLKLFVGLLEPRQGNVSVCGVTVVRENLSAVRRKAGYVFQDPESQLFLSNVWEDVAFGPRNEGLSEVEVCGRVDDALASVGISSLANEHVYRLSGGQKRLASIATVLSTRPEILLLDEPTLALDPRNRRMVIESLKKLECAKLIATHDLDFVLDVCSRVLVVSDGRIVAEGNTLDILQNRSLLESNGLELPLSLSSSGQKVLLAK
ncbi:MAG: ABC transporter ATP-binding protein [Kiritimatiellae bacterium]|nr:ABC transporter ATP-binding protein [Kiritimatiellia bacterium]